MRSTEIDALEAAVSYWKSRALTDSLTGLRNREALEEDLSNQSETYFLMVDVDDFKRINDRHGHETGDAVLCNVAEVLESVADNHGVTAYRYGGEEFLLAGEGMAPDTGYAVVQSVRQQTRVTISVGLGESISEADQRMYQSKNNGKDQYTLEGGTVHV